MYLLLKSFPICCCHQEMHVGWRTASTTSFRISNDIKQGDIYFRYSSNVYSMDQVLDWICTVLR